ncbi:hypothetical protein B0T26DRAFT_386329 [Lasiosphaeria miniovina]|uniref:Uncharacterized protein n=1 Tax=Lasiosphaeria miniovina TaxID=1954250 RepID=A0AA40DUZ9_9PEZI|nr:uncharacterized protein B0T26DRAFT_386329 [Lasiosphaeria miniovina]KAK0714171.1 hypothetical protein B0T26DRAFT_386329 [Lasiosphaeria miniovina]
MRRYSRVDVALRGRLFVLLQLGVASSCFYRAAFLSLTRHERQWRWHWRHYSADWVFFLPPFHKLRRQDATAGLAPVWMTDGGYQGGGMGVHVCWGGEFMFFGAGSS